jgi:PAS domain S-box-containing protein
MTFSVSQKVNVGFILALIVLGLSGLGSYQCLRDLVLTGQRARSNRKIIGELEALRASVARGEVVRAAYHRLREKRYQDAARLAADAAQQRLQTLAGLVSPAERPRWQDLQTAVNRWREDLDQPPRPAEPHLDPILTSGVPGQEAADEVTHAVEAFLAEAEKAFGAQEDDARDSAARAQRVIVLASALSLLVTAFSLLVINKDIASRQDAEAALHEARGSLDRRVRERTAELARANEDLRREVRERALVEAELQKVRADLERRVRERTAELARANEELLQKVRERAQVEQALRETTTLQRAILDSADYAIISTDRDGVIRTFNAAAQRYLGYAAADVVERQAPVAFHDEDELTRRRLELAAELGLPIEPGFEVLVTRARLGMPEEREWTYVRKDGSRFPVLLSVTALRNELGEVVGFLTIGSDVTARKRGEEELRRAMAAAEGANRTKSEFLANMSHELRTPLNSVIGFATLLLKNKAGNLRDQDLAFLQRVLDNGRHLLGLINQVLDLAKVEAGRMDLELGPVALDALVRETLAQLEGQMRDRKDPELVCEVPPGLPPLQADAGKLKQVLINLVGNALKFTEHGRVTVRVKADPTTNRPRCLEVMDTGPGIPRDKLNKIFEAFQQADVSTSRRYGGTGLGLTIARSLCHLMGYRLEVRSQVGVGSVFRVFFGLRAGQAPPRDWPTPSPDLPRPAGAGDQELSRFEGKRVLIIDDNADARLLLTQYVEDCGCRVVAVGSGEEGLRFARGSPPDLIVLDLMMPGMTGWEVLKALKAHRALRGVPVVVVSVVGRENRGTLLGAVDLLDKPVSREALAEVLRRNLTRAAGKALVVDDSPDARRLAAAFLAEQGFETCEAADGREALERLQSFPPDLILLDLLMPGMDSPSFLEALRRDPRYLAVPVVVVTAKELTPKEVKQLRSLAATILQKGGDLADGLKRAVREVLQAGAAVPPARAPGETLAD